MLVLTPQPHPTECISGYLHRLSATNGYSKPSWIIEPYRNGYHGDDYRRITPSVIMKIAGLANSAAERVCVRPDRHGDRTLLRLVGNELHVSHVDMQSFRICPMCVAEHGRHEAFWHLRSVFWCPIHKTSLLEECRACGVRLHWNRPGVGRCNCGADLTAQGDHRRCDAPLADLLAVLRAALYKEDHGLQKSAELKHLFHVDLYRLLRLIDVLGQTSHIHTEGRHLLDPRCREQEIGQVARIMSNWPDAFQAFLRDSYGREFSVGSSRLQFRGSFSWAICSLGKNLKEHAHQFAFLRKEVQIFGAQYWTREQLKRAVNEKKTTDLEFVWGSIPDAASAIGIDPRTLMKRIKRGAVPVQQSKTTRKSRNFKVNMAWAREQRYSASPSLGMREAARRLGISTPLLSMLEARGIYRKSYLTCRAGGYALEDVESFKLKLDELVSVRSIDGTVGGILFDGRRLGQMISPKMRAQALQKLLGADIKPQ